MSFQSEFDRLDNDVDRWKLVIAQGEDSGVMVMLDNDDTYVVVIDDEDWSGNFSGYIGWNEGAVALLEAIGVQSEPV